MKLSYAVIRNKTKALNRAVFLYKRDAVQEKNKWREIREMERREQLESGEEVMKENSVYKPSPVNFFELLPKETSKNSRRREGMLEKKKKRMDQHKEMALLNNGLESELGSFPREDPESSPKNVEQSDKGKRKADEPKDVAVPICGITSPLKQLQHSAQRRDEIREKKKGKRKRNYQKAEGGDVVTSAVVISGERIVQTGSSKRRRRVSWKESVKGTRTSSKAEFKGEKKETLVARNIVPRTVNHLKTQYETESGGSANRCSHVIRGRLHREVRLVLRSRLKNTRTRVRRTTIFFRGRGKIISANTLISSTR